MPNNNLQDDVVFTAMKAQQWERAKGEMAAMSALLGSVPASHPTLAGRFQQFDLLLADFVKQIEDNGLHE